ncbi:hypothetical protein J4E91_004489 [Alternaria rosae]|nr:hypothetical protein J4E91_004489 [Alternaria rosae]
MSSPNTVTERERELEAKQKEAKALFDGTLNKKEKDTNMYDKKRRALIDAEKDTAWDLAVRPRGSSRSQDAKTEERAATIIRAIREYERVVTFGNRPSEALPLEEDRDMGGQYLTNKDRIDNESKLYQIAKMVPKGALLHLHFNAELHPELLLVRARKMENMFIRSIIPITKEEHLGQTEMVFSVVDPKTVNPDVNIFSESYPTLEGSLGVKHPDYLKTVWMPWSKFKEEFERKFPGLYEDQEPETFQAGTPHQSHHCGERRPAKLEPAENWLRSKMVLSHDEAYGPTQTVNGVWARFNQATRAFKGLLNYESVYKEYISDAIDRMIEEKVMYAELRPMLLDKEIPADSGIWEERIENAGQMQLIVNGVEKKLQELRKEGNIDKFPFGLKIIYCTPRSIPPALMQKEMRHCIDLKLQFPNLICGFDLVGAEDRPNHIGFYKKELDAFRETCEKLDLDIPFMFHAGETLLDTGGSSDPENSNLYDAVVLKSKRIGHGFALMKHPHLVEKFKKTKTSDGICIELCPISNELLHLCRNVKEHPYPELLAAGIPCTVNSDNPSLFSNSMSHEFYQIMVGDPTMSLYSWKQLAKWSLDYSCLSVTEKREGHEILNKSWREFCRAVVRDYGPLMEDEPSVNINPYRAEASYSKRDRIHPIIEKAIADKKTEDKKNPNNKDSDLVEIGREKAKQWNESLADGDILKRKSSSH